MAKNTRNFPKGDSESLKETVNKLRSQVRRLRKENALLKSENSTLIQAWTETEDFLSEVTEDVDVEDLIKLNNKKQRLPREVIKEKVRIIEQNPEDERERVRLKWKKWRENL